MKSNIAILMLSVFLMFACKQEVKKEDRNEVTKAEAVQNKQTEDLSKDEGKQQNKNCFTQNDIVKLNNHYGEIEKILKQGGSFDLGNSIVFYTKKHSGLILRKLKESTCSARPIEFSGKCLENISFYIDYKEVFETDDGEHLSEETYEIILSKKNNKFFSKASL